MPTKKGNNKSRKNVNAYKKLSFSDDGAQEVEVRTSLPPCVLGEQRGCLKVLFQAVRWEYSIGPPAPKLCFRLKWWGEQSRGTIFRVPVYAVSDERPAWNGSFATFPIRTSIQQLRTYLKDMGSLDIEVGLGHLSDSSMVIGQLTIPTLSHLSVGLPVEGEYPVMSPQGIEFGKVMVRFSLERRGSSRQCKAAVSSEPESEPEMAQETDPFTKDTSSKTTRLPMDMGHKAENDSKTNKYVAAPLESGKTAGSQDAARRGVQLSSTAAAGAPPLDGDPLPELSGSARGNMIADLILRGRKLRESMLHAVVQASLVGTDTAPHAAIPGIPGDERMLACPESCVFLDSHSTIPGKSLGLPTDDLVALLAGDRPLSVDAGHRASSSSDEDNDIGSVDISLTETDHPLHDTELLGTLLYTEQLKDTEEMDVANQFCGGSRTQLPSDPAGSTSGPDGTQATRISSRDQTKMGIDITVGQAKMGIDNTAGQAKMGIEKTSCQAKIGDKTSLSKGGVATAESISSLASFFTSGQKSVESVESVVLHSVGMERLTKLGRVTSVRVTVEKLQLAPVGIEVVKSFQEDKKISRAPSLTYFVEYNFPMTLSANTRSNGKSTCPLQSGELIRIASRQGKGGVVFSHCSVFPVTFSSQVVQQWWDNSMVFRVYSKSSEERMPFLLGKAVLSLKQCLTASQLRSRFVVEVKTPQSVAMKGTTARPEPLKGTTARPESLKGTTARPEPLTSREEHIIGNLEVSFQFMIGKQQQHHGEEELTVDPVEQQQRPTDPEGLPTDKPLTVLQLMLFIPEGVDITLPSSCPGAKPNPYLVCKLFCVGPHPRSVVHWSTSRPLFGFKEVYPVNLTSSLLEKLCNKFVVVEVWNKTLGTTTEDELIGLVKLSVHQFYVAFVDQSSMNLCLSAELPVVAADAYSPIINPFSGARCGDLAVLMAMGNTSQLLQLQRQLAAGGYVLRPPHSMSGMEHEQPPRSMSGMEHKQPPRSMSGMEQEQLPSECQTVQSAPKSQTAPSLSSKYSAVNAGDHQASHTIEICVGGVRQLSAFSNTVWGEADCYVQYHFPTLSDQDPEEDTVCTLQPYCTETSLCVPEPTFDHTTKHTLTLNPEFPLQKVLIKACSSNGGVPFELWRRFYYPNIRDQLIAKTSLPLAKLCAMVTMQRSTPNTQSFALPLKLVIDDPEATSGGILDVCVKYHCSCEIDESPGQQERVNVSLSLGILRCTGLKGSAKQAALLPSSPLSFTAEAGVNAYIKVRLPESMVQEERRTKTIALSFAPEFSHFFDICLPLVFQQDKVPHSTQICKVPLAKILSSEIMFVEVWHEVQRRQLKGTLPDDKCFGRMLVAGSKDILLGCVELPLAQLLYRHSGASGWFPLYCKGDTPLTADRYVGGVELTLSFAREEDRELVLAHAARLGWKPNPTAELFIGSCATQQKLRFEITIDSLCVSVDDVIVPVNGEPSYKSCFVRYRFFSLDPVVSALRGMTSCAEDTAVYQLNHSSRLTIASSSQLYWYLREEPLEVQLWTSVVSKNDLPHPQTSDKLQGCAYIPLQELASQCKDTLIISGNFPLFKSGVDDLKNQRLHLTIRRTVVEELKDAPVIEIMDTPIERPPPLTTSEEETGLEAEMPHSLMDMFEVHLTVCEALHLQDVTSRESCSGPWSVYVTVQPHPTMDKIATPLVRNDGKPVWDYQCVTQIPNYYLNSECSGLEFQVWSTHHQSAEKWTGEEDVYLGCAHVDLSTLAYGLGQLCGWYHVTDFGQQIRGQLKVSISPMKRIRFTSCLKSFQSHDTHSDVGVREMEAHNLVPSDSRSTSVLFQELRNNIAELDKVIQASLEDRDGSTVCSISTTNHTCPSIPLHHRSTSATHTCSSIPLHHPSTSATHTHHSTEVGPFCSASLPDNHSTGIHPVEGSDSEHLSLKYHSHSHPSESQKCSLNRQTHVPHPPDGQTHVAHPSDGQKHVPHPSDGQTHVPHPPDGQTHVPHPPDGQTHVPHPPDGQTHVPHPPAIQVHASDSFSGSSIFESPDHNMATNTLMSPRVVHTGTQYCSPSMSPEHHMAADQEDSTSCCSTPVQSPHSSSSLTSVTRSSHHDTLGEEDMEGVGTAGREGDDKCPTSRGQAHTYVQVANGDQLDSKGMKSSCGFAATVEGGHPHVPPAAGTNTSAPYTTSSVTPLLQTEPILESPPPKGTSCKAVPMINLPDFFMPPHKLEQTMRSLRAAALSRPPPRDVLNERPAKVCGETERLDHNNSMKIGPQTVLDLSSAEIQRIAKVFSSKPKGPPI